MYEPCFFGPMKYLSQTHSTEKKKKAQARRRCVSQVEKTPNKTGQANMLEKLWHVINTMVIYTKFMWLYSKVVCDAIASHVINWRAEFLSRIPSIYRLKCAYVRHTATAAQRTRELNFISVMKIFNTIALTT